MQANQREQLRGPAGFGGAAGGVWASVSIDGVWSAERKETDAPGRRLSTYERLKSSTTQFVIGGPFATREANREGCPAR